MKCFLFDIDGTLTEPRQPMDSEFATWFENWVSERNVYLISGSDLPKIQEQIPSKILNKCKGVFSCMGNEFWIDNKNIYKNQLEIPEEVENFLESKIVNSDFTFSTTDENANGTGHVELGTNLPFSGTDNEVTVITSTIGGNDGVQVGLNDDVTISNNLSVGNDISVNNTNACFPSRNEVAIASK